MAGTVVDAPYPQLTASANNTTYTAPTARSLLAIVNLVNSTQTGITFAVTDNNGNAIYTVVAPTASQVINFPAPGLPVNGIAVAVSGGSPTAPGVGFLYRTNFG